MSQLSKSKSNLDLFGARSSRNFTQFGFELSNCRQDRRITPTYVQALNKSNPSNYSSSKSIRGEKDSENRSNDCLKKLIFDNQELLRKGKQLYSRCAYLEQENKQLTENYQNLKEKYLDLRKKYERIDHEQICEYLENSTSKKQSQNSNLFGLLFKGLSVSEAPENKQQSRKDIYKNTSSSRKFPLKSKPSIVQPQSLQKADQKQNKVINSVSIMVDLVDAETQTDFKNDDLKHLSSTSKQSELIMQIAKYKINILELEKKFNDVTYKYDRIKAIIGGHDAKSH